MKINILFGERKLQIEINKYKIVREIRCLIPDLWKENIGNYFQLIYKNIILDDEKMITFYQLKENDEIKIGKLEQFLNNDDVIVELFIAGWNATFIHLIVKKNCRISTIKSIISRIIPKIVNIWNISGNRMINNQIDLIGGYYKLIICDKSDINENDSISDQQNENDSFNECLKIMEKSLWSNYIQMSFMWEISMLDFQVNKNWLISRINKLKEILSMNEIIAPNLNEKLANFPSSFVNSKLLFCTIISNRIWDICENYFNTMIYQFTNGFHAGITRLFMTSLQIVLIKFINNSQSNGEYANKTIRTIVLEAAEYLLLILEHLYEYFGVVSMIVNYFTKSISDDDEYDDDNDHDDFIEIDHIEIISQFPKMKINDLYIYLFIPLSIKNIFQLKEAISMQTNIPIQQLRIMRNFQDEQPNDREYSKSEYHYSVEVKESS